MARENTPGRSPARRDVHAGRRLALAVEALGEALCACPDLPHPLRDHARALADGRSVVPADEDRPDFPARVRAGALPGGARALEGWLGGDLAAWVERAAPPAVVEAALTAVEAREELMETREDAAAAHRDWYAAGLDDAGRAVFARASALALGEAADRWCALGCEGDFGRYVGTWQRAASGWAATVLGTAVDIPAGDLGKLRSLQALLKELGEVPRGRRLEAVVAARLGWEPDDARRLLRMEAVVRERLDPRASLRRRWSVVKPIADAVGALEKELGRMPTVAEIAARAGVHEATVELALETLESG